jgi:hypothetical protein
MAELIFHYLDEDEIRIQLQNAASAEDKPKAAEKFFRQFQYGLYFFQGNYNATIEQGIQILSRCKELDARAYEDIHKGHIFYWIAFSAFKIRDFQTAAFFFDAAASEDMKNEPDNDKTPPLLFMVLDGENAQQAAKDLTQEAENRLTETINQYNNTQGSIPLTIDQVRQNFLKRAVGDKKEWRTLVTSLITFLLERNYWSTVLELRKEDGTREPFYIHLFKGCLLFESLLKVNPFEPPAKNEDSLGKILKPETKIGQKLGLTRKLTTADIVSSGTLSNLGSRVPCVESDIEVTEQLRNTFGHNLRWPIDLGIGQYRQLVTIVSNACLHSLATLYISSEGKSQTNVGVR